MAKKAALGARLYVHGNDLSGDVGEISSMRMGRGLLDVTAINKSAHERIVGVRDGELTFNSFFNDATAQEHAVLKPIPTTDMVVMFSQSTTLGDYGFAVIAKQMEYGLTRSIDGGVVRPSIFRANGYSLEDVRMLTAGIRTDTAATNGASTDYGAVSTAFGLSAYLEVTAFTGTDVTVKLQDSADDAAWADITGGGFTQITSGPTAERIETSLTATIRRYVRAVTVTTGGFTSVSFVVGFHRYEVVI